MCVSFLYFYKVNEHKVKIVKWNELLKKYLVETNTGVRQYVLESLLKATDEHIDNDKDWGKGNEQAH